MVRVHFPLLEIPIYEKKPKDREYMTFRDTTVSFYDYQTSTHPVRSQTNSPRVEARSLLPQCFPPALHTLSYHGI